MPEGEQWGFSLVASTAGLGLAAVGLLRRGMGDGGAALAHSGGGIGLVVGGLAEMLVTGTQDELPLAGMGYGAMGGWLVGAATAIQIHPPASDVLSVDLGGALGTLAGAAAASPLLFDAPSQAQVRGWAAAAAGGLLVGGVLGWYLSFDPEPTAPEPAMETESARAERPSFVYRVGVPTPTMLQEPVDPRVEQMAAALGPAGRAPERPAPAPGLMWQGVLW